MCGGIKTVITKILTYFAFLLFYSHYMNSYITTLKVDSVTISYVTMVSKNVISVA
jgi:hypothetical protein